MSRPLAILALLALVGCEGFDDTGKWHAGIPSTSGHYVDPSRNCIHVGTISNSMSGYYAGVLVGRVDAGERMCEGAENAGWLMLARWVVAEGAGSRSPRQLFPQTVK